MAYYVYRFTSRLSNSGASTFKKLFDNRVCRDKQFHSGLHRVKNIQSNPSYQLYTRCAQVKLYENLIKIRCKGHYVVPASGPSSQQVEGNDYHSDSDSDSDIETTTKRGESEFWRRKMRTFHRILDINKDGVISYDDFNILVNTFVNLGHLSAKNEEEFRTLIKNMWEERWGSLGPYNLVTTEQFLEDMHHVMNDKALRKKVHRFLPYLFKAVDNDRDGSIAISEYKLFFKCLRLPSEAAAMSFYAIDENNDGVLNMKEFVKLGRDFLLSEDSRKPSKLFWGPLVD